MGGLAVILNGYLSARDLIHLKEASWWEKDQLDVAALKRIIGS